MDAILQNFTSSTIKVTLVIALIFGLTGPIWAATSPSLGDAESFGVLSSTYTNTTAGTINGDLGYTTPSVTPTTVNGLIFTPKPPQAGLDQSAALADLNGQGCTFTFPAGAIDLASDTTHGTIGIYEPGVYCAPAAMSIGTTGIILSGAGTFIFRSLGALNTVVNSTVSLTNGASSCDIFWTPVATTLGANSSFIGTVIDDAGITVGDTVSWIGRALSFATTVTTDNSTISVPLCAGTTPATLHVVKQVINNNGGTALAAIFSIYVQRFGVNVLGSPAAGTTTPGLAYSLNPGTYTISEGANSLYTQSFAGDCSSTGFIKLLPGDDKTCTVINDDIAVSTPSGGGGGGSMLSMDICPNGDYSASYYDFLCGTAPSTGTIVHLTGSITALNTGNQVAISGEVGLPQPIIHLTKLSNRQTPFSFGGGYVEYTYIVENNGPVAMHNIVVTDDKGGPVSLISGDVNRNYLLDINEKWVYNYIANIKVTTVNHAIAQGEANGYTVRSYDYANVDVLVPGFPKTGLTDETNTTPWNLIILGAIFIVFSTTISVKFAKRTV